MLNPAVIAPLVRRRVAESALSALPCAPVCFSEPSRALRPRRVAGTTLRRLAARIDVEA